MMFFVHGIRSLPIRVRPTRLFLGVKCMLDFEAYSESRQSVNMRGVVAVMIDDVWCLCWWWW